MIPVELQTPRLRLRELTWDDLDFLAEMRADKEVTRFFPQSYTREETAAWLESKLNPATDRPCWIWLVCDRETGDARGWIAVVEQSPEGRRMFEIGYMFHQPFWRQGFASEAAIACRDWAFRNLPIDAIHSLILPINVPSQGVARRNGMQLEGTNLQHHGLGHDVWKITRAEWEALHPA
ncbi:GNAT family N-acetyltransferase [Planctomicrobium sp. SH664]|uniref:GNAT family N-acetyltransferase n=1 Tax=Planctomicrobium sp. SH664 TaxID=3448125 RepID=UPI003F5B4A57